MDPETELSNDGEHKYEVGDRYAVPKEHWDEGDDSGEVLMGVVTKRQRGYSFIWFSKDDRETRYSGRFEEWYEYLVDANGLTEEQESELQALEIKAALREAPRARQRRRGSRVQGPQNQRGNDVPNEGGDVQTVAVWESDAEDDENLEVPTGGNEDPEDGESSDRDLGRMQWRDVGTMITDPRAVHNGMPENIVPQFYLANFRDESYLNWFLHWFPLSMCTMICDATNLKARTIAWPMDQSWKHLRIGEFLKWLGLWVLMTVYSSLGSDRRSYWRGLLRFGQYMPEWRFENVLRVFTLPTYTRDDRGWGGPARELYEEKRFDPFWETRRFIDVMRKQFQDAIKPGGWTAIDESMFSWLGRDLKMAGWKVVKRKPHPIGLEAKTTACSRTGVLIDFEFQEGEAPMCYFEYVGPHNKSTSWLLRLTKRW